MKRPFRAAPLLAAALLAGCTLVDKITGSSDTTCSGPSTYTAGSTLTGATGVNNCTGPNNTKGQLYTMTLSQQTNMRLTVAPTAFTPFLGLYTASGRSLVQTAVDTTAKVFLPAGSYQVLVSSAAGGNGNFTLTSPTTGLAGCSSGNGTLADRDIGITTKGAVFSGTITAADCGAANAKMHWYRLYLASGDTLTASVTVDHAAGLYLINASNTAIVNKEMAAAGAWTYTYVSTADGWYALHVESRSVDGSSNLPLGYTASLK